MSEMFLSYAALPRLQFLQVLELESNFINSNNLLKSMGLLKS